MSDTIRHNNGKISLREARDRRGFSREKVAAKIGVSSKTLERWESPGARPRRIRRYLLEELADLYGIDIDEIEEAAA